MKRFILPAAFLTATPAMASSGPFFSLHNTNFVVLLAFLLFLGILFYFKVPAKIGTMLDDRALQIKAELDEARALRDEAKALLTSYEKKSREVAEQSARIVANAKDEAITAAAQAKEDLKVTIARRLAAANDRITSAQNAAVREVRETAINVAIGAARDLLTKHMTAETASASIDDAIAQVEARLH